MNNSTNGGAPGATPDPFDLEALKLPQNFADGLGVKKILTTVRVRKPNRQWFIRCHPTMRLETTVVELKDDDETYLVSAAMREELLEEVVAKVLILSMTRQGNPFIWPIRLPDSTGRLDEWSRSAIEAARHAETRWVRVAADRHAGCYQVHMADGNFPEPEWPDKPLVDLLRIAFRDRYIDTVDHPVVAQLRGRV